MNRNSSALSALADASAAGRAEVFATTRHTRSSTEFDPYTQAKGNQDLLP